MIVIPANRAVVVGIKGAAGRDLDIAPDLDARQKRVKMASGLNVGFFADANASSGTRLDEGIAVNLHAVVQLQRAAIFFAHGNDPIANVNIPSHLQRAMWNRRCWRHKSPRMEIRQENPPMVWLSPQRCNSGGDSAKPTWS